MRYLLRIGEIILGSGLWAFVFRWLIDGIKDYVIKKKLFKNVVYETFWNSFVMEFTYETNTKLLQFLSDTDIIIYKYYFTAWEIILQSGLIKNIKFNDMLFLQQLYFQIEKLDDAIKEYYKLPYNERLARKKSFIAVTNKLVELHNQFVNSKHLKVWLKKYGKSFEKDQLALRTEFKGKEFPPKELPKAD